MKIIDMIGKICPAPVIEAKKVLTTADTNAVQVAVDNIAAVRNLEKMSKGLGYEFSFKELAKNSYEVVICANKEHAIPTSEEETHHDGLVVFIGSDRMGQGIEELGKILIKGFIYSFSELPTPPQYAIFFNSGVHLTCGDSNAIDDLRLLEEKGTKVLSCGTCLNFYNLTDSLAVGEIANMYEITEIIAAACKVISI